MLILLLFTFYFYDRDFKKCLEFLFKRMVNSNSKIKTYTNIYYYTNILCMLWILCKIVQQKGF